MSNILPIIGKNWNVSGTETLESAMAHALTSDYSQSNEFNGAITSIPYIIAMNESDPIDMAMAMESSLTDYLSRFFTSVNVDVKSEVHDDERYELKLVVKTHKDGKSFDLATILMVENGVLKDIIDEINR